jgi:hypothetical protein
MPVRSTPILRISSFCAGYPAKNTGYSVTWISDPHLYAHLSAEVEVARRMLRSASPVPRTGCWLLTACWPGACFLTAGRLDSGPVHSASRHRRRGVAEVWAVYGGGGACPVCITITTPVELNYCGRARSTMYMHPETLWQASSGGLREPQVALNLAWLHSSSRPPVFPAVAWLWLPCHLHVVLDCVTRGLTLMVFPLPIVSRRKPSPSPLMSRRRCEWLCGRSVIPGEPVAVPRLASAA